MRVITARNVHQALPKGLQFLQSAGLPRGSRNGPVLLAPSPVTTEYTHPCERLTFWPAREVNVAFLIYEALWMLGGRNDLAPLTRYIKDFGRFSDDGETLHGAYGYRWCGLFARDQVRVIIGRLRANADDRRCVLQMWDTAIDLDRDGKDVPCNLMATFQRDGDGALDMTVFCRSNDVIWGAYFANAFHFSVLQEYIAAGIGCAVGIYRQVSVNYHAYLETLASLKDIPRQAFNGVHGVPTNISDPYVDKTVRAAPLVPLALMDSLDARIARVDGQIHWILEQADTGFPTPLSKTPPLYPFFQAAHCVLRAHEIWRTQTAPERYVNAFSSLDTAPRSVDAVAAMTTWIAARHRAWERRMHQAQDDGVAYEQA